MFHLRNLHLTGIKLWVKRTASRNLANTLQLYKYRVEYMKFHSIVTILCVLFVFKRNQGFFFMFLERIHGRRWLLGTSRQVALQHTLNDFSKLGLLLKTKTPLFGIQYVLWKISFFILYLCSLRGTVGSHASKSEQNMRLVWEDRAVNSRHESDFFPEIAGCHITCFFCLCFNQQ